MYIERNYTYRMVVRLYGYKSMILAAVKFSLKQLY